MISLSKIAKLANLTIPRSKVADFEKKLEETIKYIDLLNQINTSGTIPTAQVGNQINKLRNDVIEKERIVPAKIYKAKISWTN